MSTHYNEIERQARALPAKEKAALARLLIEDLDPSVDDDAEQAWADEARRRYDAYQNGELEGLPGDEVMVRARNRIK
jgi:putative addiction module component (TIGR02574 family)